jgi:multidrug resistance efflux pump
MEKLPQPVLIIINLQEMLNISEKRIDSKVDKSVYGSFQILETRSVTQWLIRVMAITSLLAFLSLFLPWTQNIRAKGYVSTLSPSDRPQSIQSLIGGRIEKWYVIEGDQVKQGDTIARLSEVKEEYLDPEILLRTQNQINAKKESSGAYADKAENLVDQYYALVASREIKLKQNEIKRRQVFLKIMSDSIDLVAAQTKMAIAENQLVRMEELYKDGLKPLTDLEDKRLSIREVEAKVVSLENKLTENRNELDNIDANIIEINNSFQDKIAKSRSDKNAAKSEQYNADAEVNKLQSKYNAYEVRQKNYFITSPIDGIVTRAMQSGIGEMIKNGDDLVTIMPDKYDLAVEMYVEPVDVPLLEINQKVRIQFDGWPSIIFSGWPNASVGTFGGVVYAIDNFISDNGKYRVLVSGDPSEIPWPEEVRVGGGANTITLLKNVKLGYEIWRQLNGFPPDYYASRKLDEVKTKAPLKKVK